MADKINNALHNAKGGAKEALGRGIGNEQMAAEGKIFAKISLHRNLEA